MPPWPTALTRDELDALTTALAADAPFRATPAALLRLDVLSGNRGSGVSTVQKLQPKAIEPAAALLSWSSLHEPAFAKAAQSWPA